MDPDNTSSAWSRQSHVVFFLLLTAIVSGAVIRSNITTGLDSFTFDEAYHVGAGAAYIQTGDFRLNPEQPPLTKLWTGAYVTMLGYNLSPYRSFSDKSDERDFVEVDAYENNDPFILQSRARASMLALNAVLMFCFGLAARRVFGDVVAIAAVLYLAIDPTVAAHMPVVMTDLPIGLTSGIAVLLAAAAFKTWRAVDLALAAVGLGLALSAKHSGIIVLIGVALIGVAVAIFFSKAADNTVRLKRVGAVAAVTLGGVIILWAFYGFQYRETPGSVEDTFNRPLAQKIGDVRSPVHRLGLNIMADGRLFPRSYVWGLADTIRAGVEGRAIPVLAFGSLYYAKAPAYYFPGVIAAKLPLGLLILSITGMVIFAMGRLPREFLHPFLILAAFSVIFLIVLMRGSSYAGVRHAMPLFPIMAILGAFAVYIAVSSRSYLIAAGTSLLFVAAAASAIPQMRPWEYFNEIAGGPENGYLYFNDEGVDLSQRMGEIAGYFHSELEPRGEVPFLTYFSGFPEKKSRGMDWVGRNHERDAHRFDGETVTGTFIIGANELGPKLFWDSGKPLRALRPITRFGNIFVFQGTIEKPAAALSRRLYNQALYENLYVPDPDIPKGLERLSKSIELDPSGFCASLELGNQYLKLGDREQALKAYRTSYQNAPQSDAIYDMLGEQLRRVESEPLESIAPLRNPGIE